ncbi:MAG: acyltransferase [Bacilli bacterium]|nr:acyltransferase [Bacilli bacterium]
MSSFYSPEELKELGLKKIGCSVLISKKASIYSPSTIELGNNVRIDDFCILSGNIKIGNYVHISAYTALYGKGGIVIGDYCGCSPRCTLFSQTDDFSGEYMIGPLVEDEYTNVITKPIIMEKYSQIGANSVVMPGVTIKEGAVAGALSYVVKELEPWTINVGIPTRKIKERSKQLLKLADKREGKNNNV